jgi:hypothetical protein
VLHPSTCSPTPDADPTTPTDNDGAVADCSEGTLIQPGNRILCSNAQLQLVTGYWEDSGQMKTTQGMTMKKFQHQQPNSLSLQHHVRDF